MSRTTTTAFDGQTTQSITVSVPVVDIAGDYSILERDVTAGSTVLSNISADPSLQELLSFKFTNLPNVQVHPKLRPVYDPSTKDGYQIVVKDEWIERTTETDGTIHDDPVQMYWVFKATRGANIPDGDVVLGRLIRILGVAAPVVAASLAGGLGDPTYELSDDTLDRLIHGVTKPSTAS